jgi:ABC-2 type transport system permease protein
MAVYKRGYQRYQGPLTGHYTRLLAMPRFAWQRLYQQRLVIILTAAALIWPMLCAVYVYLANHSELWASLGPNFRNIIEVNGKFFLVFMNVQSVFAMLLASLAGPGLIAPDLANNGLPLYFSRPLSRLDYVLARMLVLVGMLSIVTWLPGILLFTMQSGMAGSAWLGNNWRLAPAIIGGFFIWILLVSLVALASSAYVKWRVIAGGIVLGYFFVLSGVAEIINSVFRVTWGSVLNPAKTLYHIWCVMLDVDPPQGLDTIDCVSALLAMAVLLALVLERKLRPVEVIS